MYMRTIHVSLIMYMRNIDQLKPERYNCEGLERVLTDPHPSAERPRTVHSGPLSKISVRLGWVESARLVAANIRNR